MRRIKFVAIELFFRTIPFSSKSEQFYFFHISDLDVNLNSDNGYFSYGQGEEDFHFGDTDYGYRFLVISTIMVMVTCTQKSSGYNGFISLNLNFISDFL